MFKKIKGIQILHFAHKNSYFIKNVVFADNFNVIRALFPLKMLSKMAIIR
jgi:hypothetical protein